MAVEYKNDGGQYKNEQGTILPLPVVKALVSNADGSPMTNGRQPASGSRPMVLSAEDKAALDAANSGYSTASPYVVGTARAAGRGILAVATTAGNAIFTFGGVAITFPLNVGPTILPLAVTKVDLPGTGAAAGTFYAIS